MEDPSVRQMDSFRSGAVSSLWNLTQHFNVLNKQRWTREVNAALHDYETGLVDLVETAGYDGKTVEERWTFPAALMFALR